MKTKEDVVKTWFRRVWNEGDTGAIDEMLVPHVESRGLGENSIIGPEAFKVFHKTVCDLISDIEITVDKTIEQNEWISAICSLKAKGRQNGKPVSMTGHVLVKVEGDKLIEAYNHWDFIKLFSELDLMPAQTFAQALGGQKIA